MDFAKILDEWEKTGRSTGSTNNWFESDGFWDSYDKGEEEREDDKVKRRECLRSMAPESEIDLHGLSVEEALLNLDRFLREASRRGLRKVLIIHGKGNHSKEGPVLPGAVHDFLRSSPLAGETGIATRDKGGRGATWVIVRPMGK